MAKKAGVSRQHVKGLNAHRHPDVVLMDILAEIVEHPEDTVPGIRDRYLQKHGELAPPEPTVYRWRTTFLEKCAWIRIPMLSSHHKLNRLMLCQWATREWFENLFITDEKWFYLQNKRYGLLKKGCWCMDRSDRRRFTRTTAGRIRVQIWGGISLRHGCTPPVITIGSIKAPTYVRILKTQVEPDFGDLFREGALTFQQDNAKIHTAASTAQCIADLGWKTFKWPPNSCDFSPIEFMWAMMVSELETYWKPRNVSELVTAISHVWASVTRPESLEKCWARAMTNMVQSVAEGGDNTYTREKCNVHRKWNM